jgi:hypothetical protein
VPGSWLLLATVFKAIGNLFKSISALGNVLRLRCAGQAPHPRGVTIGA